MNFAHTRIARAAWCALLLNAALVASPADPTPPTKAWLDGDADAALVGLGKLPASRERDFNQGIVLLYSGKGEAAERLFSSLREHYPSWAPAMRWLARAQRDTRRPEAVDNAIALLKMSGATGRDHFWAARLFIERNDLARARESFRRAVAEEDDLFAGWNGLAEVEQALGHAEEARVARDKAGTLYPGGLSKDMTPPPPLPRDRTLRYQGKYLVVPIGTVTLSEGTLGDFHGRPSRLVTLEAKSALASFVMHINSRFESYVGADGSLLSHRDTSNDSTSGRRQSTFESDPATDSFKIRQAGEGLFSYEVIKVPPQARPHDGISMIGAARAVARSRSSLAVVRVVDAAWKGTLIRTVRSEPITWHGRKIETVCVEISITSKSAAGVVGTLDLWISADESAIPYRARMGTGFGSVTLELMEDDGEER